MDRTEHPFDDWASADNVSHATRVSGCGAREEDLRETRACQFYDGGRVEEEIVDYEFESGYTVDFVDVGEMPLKENPVELPWRNSPNRQRKSR